MRRGTPAEPYATEAELCDSLRSVAAGSGWLVYPEHHADLLLVAGPNAICESQRYVRSRTPPEGTQVAVQAKLRPSMGVLYQALPPRRRWRGRPQRAQADIYAVLVPWATSEFIEVARCLDIYVLEGFDRWGYRRGAELLGGLCHGPLWPRSPRRLSLPALHVPDLPAGVRSPRPVTEWKLRAIRFFLGAPAEFGNADIHAAGLDPRRLEGLGWIQRVPAASGKIRYAAVDIATRPDRANPEIVAALRREDAQ